MSIPDNFFEKIFDNFKKITPALTAVAILTGMILFLPKKVLERMNLSELPPLWSTVIGLVFLLSLALILTSIIFPIVEAVKKKRRNQKLHKDLKKKYLKLSTNQKNIIIKLLKSKDKTILLDATSGDTLYLVDNAFIHKPQQFISLGWDNEITLKYVPQPWLIDLYNNDPSFFTTNTTEKK